MTGFVGRQMVQQTGAETKMERVYYTERLLDAFRRYYDVNQEVEGAPEEFFARCDFHVTDARYVLSKKNVLWSTDSHEYCYIFSLDHLTLDDYRRFEKYAYDDGMKRITPGHGHKCTAITLIAVCKLCLHDEAPSVSVKCGVFILPPEMGTQ